ncbi:hypothetical protein Tco_0442014 [Tanacetum coccineum]
MEALMFYVGLTRFCPRARRCWDSIMRSGLDTVGSDRYVGSGEAYSRSRENIMNTKGRSTMCLVKKQEHGVHLKLELELLRNEKLYAKVTSVRQ